MPHKTNTELVTDLMEFSKCGGLMQAFVIEALIKYSQLTLAAAPWDPNNVISHMLSQDAWKACAAEALKTIEERS